MALKDVVKNFVIPYFDTNEEFFNIAWDFIDANYDKIRSNVLSQHGKITQSAIPLGFVGETEVPVLKAILIFNTGFKQVNLTGDIGQNILASVQEACSQYMAERKLTREILQMVKSGKDEIVSLLKGRQKIEEEKEKNKKKEVEREKLGYVVFLSQPSGIGTIIDDKTKTEEGVQRKYLKKKEDYDIFIYEQTMYRKAIDRERVNMIILNLDRNILNLLVLFLKYKNIRLPYEKLYNKAWEGSLYHDTDAKVKVDAVIMNGLKTAVTTLRNEFEYIKGFSIPHARAGGYICEGDFKFCLVLKISTDHWYTLEGV